VVNRQQTHLFDIDIPGKITFQESATLTAGSCGTVVDTEVGRLGIGICFDVRFPDLAAVYAARGAHFLIFPGASPAQVVGCRGVEAALLHHQPPPACQHPAPPARGTSEACGHPLPRFAHAALPAVHHLLSIGTSVCCRRSFAAAERRDTASRQTRPQCTGRSNERCG
jgi:hypothetical protein